MDQTRINSAAAYSTEIPAVPSADDVLGAIAVHGLRTNEAHWDEYNSHHQQYKKAAASVEQARAGLLSSSHGHDQRAYRLEEHVADLIDSYTALRNSFNKVLREARLPLDGTHLPHYVHLRHSKLTQAHPALRKIRDSALRHELRIMLTPERRDEIDSWSRSVGSDYMPADPRTASTSVPRRAGPGTSYLGYSGGGSSSQPTPGYELQQRVVRSPSPAGSDVQQSLSRPRSSSRSR
jgi:hypothetical protein